MVPVLSTYCPFYRYHFIDDWIHYYMYERYQRRFGVKTPYEVRSEALSSQTPNQYPIPDNKRIIKYKREHYTGSTTLAA